MLPTQKKFSVFNKVYLVNHLRDILDCSYKWLVFKYCYRPQKDFGFTLKRFANSTTVKFIVILKLLVGEGGTCPHVEVCPHTSLSTKPRRIWFQNVAYGNI